jgi:hypothetical protein
MKDASLKGVSEEELRRAAERRMRSLGLGTIDVCSSCGQKKLIVVVRWDARHKRVRGKFCEECMLKMLLGSKGREVNKVMEK